MMDVGTAIALASLIGAPVAGGLWWGAQKVYGAFTTLGDHGRRLGAVDGELAEMRATQEQHDARIERTEDAARNIGKLADAISAMGDKVNVQIGHLAEVMGIHNKNNEQRFDELNDRLGEKRTFRSSDK